MWVKCDICDKNFNNKDEGQIVNDSKGPDITFCDNCYETRYVNKKIKSFKYDPITGKTSYKLNFKIDINKIQKSNPEVAKFLIEENNKIIKQEMSTKFINI